MKTFFQTTIAKIMSAVLVMQLFVPCVQIFAVDLPDDANGYVFSEFTTGKVPDITFYNEGNLVTVEELPASDSKSLAVQTRNGATQFYLDLPIYSGSNQCVLETSIAYDGALASLHRIFTLSSSSGAYLVFMTLDTSGNLLLYDGTLLTTLTKGMFCEISLIIDFNTSTCSVKIDGKTLALDVPLSTNNFIDATKARIQMSNITSDSERFYINYFYSKGEKAQVAEGVAEPVEVNVTNATVKKKMNDHVLMTTKNGKALVDNKIKDIDSENPNVAPTIINGRTLVPLRFISEAFNAKVNYDEATATATITLGKTEIKVTQGIEDYTVNGEKFRFDVAPANIGGRILVPLRAIAEALGQPVFWDKCGYILIGKDAVAYDLNNQEYKETLDLAVRDLLFDNPTAEDVVQLIKSNNPNKDHPRLLVRKEELPALRAKVANDPRTAEYMKNVIAEADASIDLEPLPYGRVDGPRMLQTNRKAVDRIESMAFAYLITGEKKYADGAIEVMMNVCGDNFPDWNPYHFLDVGELSAGVALGYDWCYDAMTPEERNIVEKAIAEKSLKEIIKDLNFETTSEDRSFKWNSSAVDAYPQNWVSVCVGGCSMAALAIGDKNDEYAALAGEVISKGLEHVKDLLAKFAPDGAWYEGPNYWLLAFEFFALGFESYQNALGTDFGLTSSPGFHNGGYYIIGQAGPMGNFNLDACVIDLNDCPEIYWLANEFDDATLAVWRRMFMEKKQFKGDYRDVLWYRPDLDTTATDTLSLDGAWRGFNITASRTGVTDNDMFVAFHGGDYVGLRSQLDSGTFIMDMFGVRWAHELGYDHLDYSDGGKQTRYRGRGEGHNTMIFNPDHDLDLNPYANCTIDNQHNSLASISVSDLTQAHIGDGVESRIRGIMVDKSEKYVVIQDEFKTKEPAEMYWFLHTQGNIEIASDGKNAIFYKDNKKMLVKLLGENDFTFEKMNAVSLPTSPKVKMDSDAQIWKLFIHSDAITEGTISVVMTPLAGNETDVNISYSQIPIDSWTLKPEVDLPVLTSISVGGRKVDLNDGQTIYSELYDLYNSDGIGFEIKAEGEGDVQITQITDDNNVAKIVITKDGITNNYYFALTQVGMNEVQFVPHTSQNTLSNAGALKEIKIHSVYAPDVPQPENAPANTIDGDYATRYSSELYGTTIDFDLGSVQKIDKVGVAFSVGDKRSTRFRIAISEDGKKWVGVGDILSPDDTLDMVLYDIGTHNARYVRLIGFGNTQGSKWFSPTEVAVYSD